MYAPCSGAAAATSTAQEPTAIVPQTTQLREPGAVAGPSDATKKIGPPLDDSQMKMKATAEIARSQASDAAVQPCEPAAAEKPSTKPGAVAVQGPSGALSIADESESLTGDMSDADLMATAATTYGTEGTDNVFAAELVEDELDDVERQNILNEVRLAAEAGVRQEFKASAVAAEVVDKSELEDTVGNRRCRIIAVLEFVVVIAAAADS
jgi:hypothetical protein